MKKQRFIVFVFFVVLLALMQMGNSEASEILTNEVVLTMVKSGLGDDLIISKIKNSQCQFDLSADNILKLKKEGVGENILKTMIETPSSTDTSGQGNQHTATNPMAAYLGLPSHFTFNSSSLYAKIGGKVSEMPRIIAEISHSMKKHFIPYYFGAGDNWHFIRGEKSVIRIANNRPIFFTKLNPSSFLLVRLSYQSAKDIRYVVSTGSAYKNTMPLKFEKKSDDFFEISPANELSPGEYAFVQSMTFYDFGID